MTHYELLGVSRTATAPQIKAAWRALVKDTHPDTTGNASEFWKQEAEERTKAANEAYEVLSDATKRAKYDTALEAGTNEKTRKANNTTWRPGQSGNPSGKPKSAHQPGVPWTAQECHDRINEELRKKPRDKVALQNLRAILKNIDNEAERAMQAQVEARRSQAQSGPASAAVGENPANGVVLKALHENAELLTKLKTAEKRITDLQAERGETIRQHKEFIEKRERELKEYFAFAQHTDRQEIGRFADLVDKLRQQVRSLQQRISELETKDQPKELKANGEAKTRAEVLDEQAEIFAEMQRLGPISELPLSEHQTLRALFIRRDELSVQLDQLDK
jgi:curved DNA-binding protein CbpA